MKKYRAWQRMLSGRRLDLLDPTPLDIEIEDIAHGLSFVARWNGQTHGDFPYSVAEHSLLVEQIYSKLYKNPEKKWCLAALLHDAPEYVIGDMISPVKSAIGSDYQSLENRLSSAINLRFGLPTKLPENISDPSDDPQATVIWEAFKPDTEPPRETRQDQIAELREELLALIRRGTDANLSSSDGQPSDFVEEQGGIY